MPTKHIYDSSVQTPFSVSDTTIKEQHAELNQREVIRLVNPRAFVDHPEAVLRNRHQHVLPWDFNRIQLRGIPYSYINASPISLGEKNHKEKYIACQGPLDSSHMWRMTWEQDVTVIVMLTTPFEGGAEKCLQYYPEDEADCIDEGGFNVTLLEKTQNGCSDLRKLQLSHDGEQRTIWHFLFKTWPDHGVPLDIDLSTLFSMIKLSQAKNESSNARIIHCSAGVGRTGVFIAFEHLFKEMDRGIFDNATETNAVFDTVDCLRQQRMRMVNLKQFLFLYKVLSKRWSERQSGHDEKAGKLRES